MKIDRLMGILTILLKKEKVTAPYLAEKFEVSRRTINRDIEDLMMAGIPIVTEQGKNGGISIIGEYKIDKTMFTPKEMQSILVGLQGLNSVSDNKKYQRLIEKLPGSGNSNSSMFVDLSTWYKDTIVPKIDLIQKSIDKCMLMSFTYLSPNRESSRRVEPYCLVFQWSSWYLWAFCLESMDYRFFKLTRIEELKILDEGFEPRENVKKPCPAMELYKDNINAVVTFDPQVKWRIFDEYGRESFTETEDGRLLFEKGFDDKSNLINWVLSFGSMAELLQPKELREEMLEITAKMKSFYEK